jgi:hypothetical protein
METFNTILLCLVKLNATVQQSRRWVGHVEHMGDIIIIIIIIL